MLAGIPDDDDDDDGLSGNARRATRAHLRDEEGRVQATKAAGAARSFRGALGGPALQLPVGLCRLAFACHGQCLVISTQPNRERYSVPSCDWTAAVGEC